ncbi:hypothetical protein [Paraburkholderia sp. GAS334]|uniref:hypothetical protein n=1 Tax=unclassified Paraburkholderia TaxID=2615204 RepID=UPI003D23C3BD
MRYLIIALSMLLCPAISVHGQISVDVGVPGVNIGTNMQSYPELVPVPGYPVYYAPQANSNYFFYDGLYWVYQQDNWYSSSWYNGPWQSVGPMDVPPFVLRIPVRYYREPPAYFRDWSANAPPHWSERWGRDWEARRTGWDHWDRRAVPRAAPPPDYQRQYSGDRYPRTGEQQYAIRSANYRYQPGDAVTRQDYRQQGNPGSSRAGPQQQAPMQRSSTQELRSQPNQQQLEQRQQPHPQPDQQQLEQRQQLHSQPDQQQLQQRQKRQPEHVAQQAPPSQPMHQAQSMQPPSQMQRAQTAPQERGREPGRRPQSEPPVVGHLHDNGSFGHWRVTFRESSRTESKSEKHHEQDLFLQNRSSQHVDCSRSDYRG